MPKISVVIPAYNAERTILETIESVLNQTLADFEIIVINDGSSDRTLERLSTIQDPRLHVFSYPNRGVAAARNQGIRHAQGEYFAFLDADDLWTPDKLSSQVSALQQNPEASVAYSWAYFMDENGESIYPDQPIFYQGNVYSQLLVRDFIVSGSNCLIRRAAVEDIGEFDATIPGADDWDYWIRLARTYQFVVVEAYQIFYRQSSGSVSSKVEAMEQNNLQVIEKNFQAAPPDVKNLKKQSLANTYRYSAHLYLTRVGGTEGAKKAAEKLGRSLRLYPPLLKDSWTRNLMIKSFLLRFLSPQISEQLVQSINRLRTIRQPNLQ